jgi:hypothetical protein
LVILAAVKINASNTGRTDVFRKSDYFVNKYSGIFYWSNGFIYKNYKNLKEFVIKD